MDKIASNSDEEVVRLYCDCFDPQHVLEVRRARVWQSPDSIEFRPYVGGSGNLRWRLREAWHVLTGKDAQLSEFFVRGDDIVPLAHFILEAIRTTVSNEYTFRVV